METTSDHLDKIYTWGDELGVGAFGTVKKAKNVDEPGEEYALKFFELGGSKKQQERQKREAKCLSGLNHEHVVKLITFCTNYKLGELGMCKKSSWATIFISS